ncbi:FprA family A-type flavoprotein [Azovibrio restrictus]|uniref:FprA family A-type flavoprotein n=1 Tax=Azovibrio restrictus TaxID=146938 RepID=UPI0026EC3386|nr:FprA family A-type flavoprotein [Azovibrio restrictus]
MSTRPAPAVRVRPGQAVEIAERVHWIGVLDPDLRSFDIVLSTANGTTYNSYVVRGDKGVAVIDTVKEAFAPEFFQRLESVCSYDEITTIVINHLEPDHSGALPELMKRAPQAHVYLSSRAPMMFKALLKSTDVTPSAFTLVKTGSRLDLGGRTLAFYQTPFLHWPDTQCTYVPELGLLFSGDVFGCHFCDDRLFNDKVGDFGFSFEYYYAHIMRPFRQHVLAGLEQLEPLDLQLIAPAHGPVLRQNPRRYVQRYRELATARLNDQAVGEKTLLIFYISAYGATRRMAEAIATGAEEEEGVRVSLYDLEVGDVSPFIDLIETADGIAVGSPTINGDATKPVWDLLSSLHTIHVRGKLGAAFGSFGWSGEAVAMMEDRLKGLRLHVPFEGLRLKLVPTEEELAQCQELGRKLARHLVTPPGELFAEAT